MNADASERMQAKIEDVILQLHDLTMDMSASPDARALARLKKCALPGILEFVKDETLSTCADKSTPGAIVTYLLIFFGEMLASFTHAYKGSGTPEEVWESYSMALREIFLDVFNHHLGLNETQSNETDRPTQA